jgi:hypothetical protein
MPPVIKKPCLNNEQYSYSGKELSPLGNGYSADAEQVGTIKEGRDKSMWMIGIKNGVKVWNRVPTDLSKDSSILADLTPPEMKKAEEVTKKKTAPAKKKEPKKTAAKAKVTIVSESEADETTTKTETITKTDDETEETAAEKTDEKADEKAEKKKKTVKKTGASEDSKKKVTKKTAAVSVKKRQPTDFNIFMSYQIKIVKEENPGMSHKENFAKVASLWKSMDEKSRNEILEKAKKTIGGDAADVDADDDNDE